MKKALGLIVMGLTAIITTPVSAEEEGNLDNSAWRVYEIGKKKPMDTLVFIKGQFTSTDCVPYGFYTGSYSAKANGDQLTWNATQNNEANEKMEWSGTANGSEMKGTYTYVTEKGKAETKQWRAEKLKK